MLSAGDFFHSCLILFCLSTSTASYISFAHFFEFKTRIYFYRLCCNAVFFYLLSTLKQLNQTETISDHVLFRLINVCATCGKAEKEERWKPNEWKKKRSLFLFLYLCRFYLNFPPKIPHKISYMHRFRKRKYYWYAHRCHFEKCSYIMGWKNRR